VAGVVDFRPIDGDGHQAAIDLYLAVLAHGVPLLLVNEGLSHVAWMQNDALLSGHEITTWLG
jgi:hypothetical protein